MIPRSFGTHSGTFHADEVTAAALLKIFNLIDIDKIQRTRDLRFLKDCEYVCDVGGVYNPQLKKFDHHQNDYQGDMSSAGMVLLYLKEQAIITEEEYSFLERSLIAGIDAHDNGKANIEPGVCTFSQVVTNFAPTSYEASEEQMKESFLQALHFVCGHLERMMDRYHYVYECRKEVIEAMKLKDKLLIFNKSIPWMDVFFDMDGEHHPALFVIMPAGTHWKLRGIPPSSKERMKVRLPLPEEWAGLMDEDLRNKTGIPGAIFCHKGRFISIWETKSDALKALSLVLNFMKVENR